MKQSVLIFVMVLAGCASRNPIDDAKSVVKSHEEFLKAGNLDGVVSNAAEDIVCLIPGVPLIKGKGAFRDFYAGMFKTGRVYLQHEYQGADIVGDAVVLYGVAKGTLTKPDSTTVSLANNFIFTLTYQPGGKMELWRVAFAASQQQQGLP